MEPQELLDWLDNNRVGNLCGLEEDYSCIHFFGTSCCVEVNKDLFTSIIDKAEPHERQKRVGEISVSYPTTKLYDVVLNHTRLRKLLLLLED